MADGYRSSEGLHVSPTTEFAELFLRNVILNENNELRNRDTLVGASLAQYKVQSSNTDNSKSQIETLDCTLEELAVLRVIENNPQITQTEIAKNIKKSASNVKRITSALVERGILIRKKWTTQRLVGNKQQMIHMRSSKSMSYTHELRFNP